MFTSVSSPRVSKSIGIANDGGSQSLAIPSNPSTEPMELRLSRA
jgi:hypothetical protein